jgi:hypothetical protein
MEEAKKERKSKCKSKNQQRDLSLARPITIFFKDTLLSRIDKSSLNNTTAMIKNQ